MLTRLSVVILIFGLAQGYKFPNNFIFGVGTAATQIEGAWNVSGRSPSMWDYYLHKYPERVTDHSNADVACDSYHRIDEDIKNLAKLKVNFYRFSISWPRLLPDGYSNNRNPDGIRYYNELINKLLANNIQPFVTIFHWDIPQTLQEIGGFLNEQIVTYMRDFADVCFELFGDRVKHWGTINEPNLYCQLGYESATLPPYIASPGVGLYQCQRHMLLSHATIYHLYQRKYKKTQNGEIGFAANSVWYTPYDDKSPKDIAAAERLLQFNIGLMTHPIYSKEGDYPEVVRARVDSFSKDQNFSESRLITLSPNEIDYIKGTFDFLGVNHYTTLYGHDNDSSATPNPSLENDIGASVSYNTNWESTGRDIFRVVPSGFRQLLIWFKKQYGNVKIIITENGYGGLQNESLNDLRRVNYYNQYLKELLKAMHEDECNIVGYSAWSFMDNFEWTDGYTLRFGLYYIDFSNANLTRVPKTSAYNYQNIIVTKTINDSLIPTTFLH